MMSVRGGVALFSAAVLMAPVASAQVFDGGVIAHEAQAGQTQPTRFELGGALMYADPRGEFARNVSNGWGGGGSLRYNIDRGGILSLRVDGGFSVYGSETRRVPLSGTVGGRIMVDVTTSNTIGFAGIGPQLTVPAGPVRPYGNASISWLGFNTSSSVRGSRTGSEDFASSTNFSDNTSARVLGGGIYIPLGGVRSRTMLDLGVRYHDGGEASYLREGSIEDNPDGSITITPLRSRTPFVVYQLGLSFNIPRSSTAACPSWLC